ncbi:MAG TPA: hypothetical protein VFR99_01130 [Marmoricola sp.]|nr:hypothetical protein [Marmoricola sp.]
MNTHPHLMSMMATERITERRRQASRLRAVRRVRRAPAASRRR